MKNQIRIQTFISVDGKDWDLLGDLVSEKPISVDEVLAELEKQGFRPLSTGDVSPNPPVDGDNNRPDEKTKLPFVDFDAEKVPSTAEVLAEMDERGLYPLQFDYRAPPPGHRFLAVRK